MPNLETTRIGGPDNSAIFQFEGDITFDERNNEELIFRKPAPQNISMEVNQNTGEWLVDWVNRKAKKNVFGMLTLLSARLDTVSGASWTCEFSSGVLVLINLKLGEQNCFALGFGPSNTKARKAAGENMLMKVDLTEFLIHRAYV